MDRIDQIDREIASEHWETLTKTRPLRFPREEAVELVRPDGRLCLLEPRKLG